MNKLFLTKLPNDAGALPVIIRELNKLAGRYGQSPVVRFAAVSQMNGIGDDAQEQQAERLNTFVKNSVTYLNDPCEGEYVTSPVQLLKGILAHGQVFGDCDDHVLLLASLLKSIGREAVIAGVKLDNPDGTQSPDYNHVVVLAWVRGAWRVLDPCAKSGDVPAYVDFLTP